METIHKKRPRSSSSKSPLEESSSPQRPSSSSSPPPQPASPSASNHILTFLQQTRHASLRRSKRQQPPQSQGRPLGAARFHGAFAVLDPPQQQKRQGEDDDNNDKNNDDNKPPEKQDGNDVLMEAVKGMVQIMRSHDKDAGLSWKRRRVIKENMKQDAAAVTKEEDGICFGGGGGSYASLLLPWVTRHLSMRPQQFARRTFSHSDFSMWNVLEACILNPSSLPSSHVFTPSFLHKIVPAAARDALTLRRETTREADTRIETEERLTPPVLCFQVLCRDFYRPSVDYACHELLLTMDEMLRPHMQSPPDWTIYHLVLSTAQLLDQRIASGAGRDKRVFLSLSSPPLLAALSRFHQVLHAARPSETKDGQENATDKDEYVIKFIVQKGLFHSLHHIAVFNALSTMSVPTGKDTPPAAATATTATKTVYVSNLFDSIIDMLSPESESATSLDAAALLPLLVEGFFVQSRQWATRHVVVTVAQEQQGAAGTKRTKSTRGKQQSFTPTPSHKVDIANLHFRFWSCLVEPITSRLEGSNQSTPEEDQPMEEEEEKVVVDEVLTRRLVQTLRDCVRLLVQHNVYQPTFEDVGGVHFAFLKWVSTTVLHHAHSSLETKTTAPDLVDLLQMLFELNHLLLHDQLSRLVWCAAAADTDTDEKVGRSLITTLIGAYQNLRQLDHFLVALVDATEWDDTCHNTLAVEWILHDSQCVTALSHAIRACPTGQINDLWTRLQGWILQFAVPTGDGLPKVVFVVQLFGLFTKSIRMDTVDRATTVRLSCQDSMKKIVVDTFFRLGRDEHTQEDHALSFREQGLILAASLVDLHTRASFWTPGAGVLELDFVSSLVAEEKKATCSSFLEALQLLCLFRVLQLHSLIHEQELVEVRAAKENATETTQEKDKDTEHPKQSQRMIQEAKDLVEFVMSSATADTTSMAVWTWLAAHVAFWSPYAPRAGIHLFLEWFYSAVSCRQSHKNDDAAVLFSAQEAAHALLKDASFLEVPALAANKFTVGWHCVVTALLGDEKKDWSSDGNVNMLVSPLDDHWTPLSVDDALALLKTAANGKNETSAPPHADWEQALFLVRLLNGFGRQEAANGDCTTTGAKERLMRMEMAFRLGLYAQMVLQQGKSSLPHHDVIVNVVCGAWSGLADAMMEGWNDPTPVLTQVASDLFGSILMSPQKDPTFGGTKRNAIVQATMKVVEVTVSYGIREASNGESAIFTSLGRVLRESLDKAESRVRSFILTLVRTVARRINGMQETVLDNLRAALRLDGKEMHQFWSRILDGLQDHAGACALGSEDDDITSDAILAFSDVLRFHVRGKVQSETRAFLVHGVSIISGYAAAILGKDTADSGDVKFACGYFLACLSTVVTECQQHEVVVNDVDLTILTTRALLDTPDDETSTNRLLTSAFAGFVRHADRSQLCLVRNKVTADETCLVRFVHLLSIICTSVANEALAKEVFGDVLQRGVVLTLELLTLDLESVVLNKANVGLEFLKCIVTRKNLIVLNGQEVALILGKLVTLVRGQRAKVAESSFVLSVCHVVNLLQKHYSNRIFKCVAVFMSVVRALLLNLMAAPMEKEGLDKEVQEFTKICEMLSEQPDVFKKHVIGLLLHFVDGLLVSMAAKKRRLLLPAIFALLDTCAHYEKEQLNSMMDASARGVFASVYKTYQDVSYKGQ